MLDLFAGIGSISFEFASRGTQHIICVDKHFNSLRFIKKTAEEFSLPIQTIKSDAYTFLEKTSSKHTIIFADPPYEFTVEQLSKIITLVFDKEMLTDDGMLIIEHSKQTDVSKNKHFSYSKKYGGSVFSFFEKNE